MAELIDIQLKGIDGLHRFARVATKWVDTGMVEAFADAAIEDAKLRIEDDEVDAFGGRWKKWSEGYAKTRGPAHKLLFGEGDLAKSFSSEVSRGRAVISSDVPYAARHQFHPTEKRPYMGVSRSRVSLGLKDALAGIFDADLAREFGRAR